MRPKLCGAARQVTGSCFLLDTVFIVGFQASGTLGRRLVDGTKVARIFGEDVPVRAQMVTSGGFSAHADQSALLEWLARFRTLPERMLLVHGEESVANVIAARIETRFQRRASIPDHGESLTF